MFETFLSGTILLVSIVVSIAAVGISQELTSLGDQSERIETTIDFQAAIEDHDIVDVSPARPGQFTAVVHRSIKQRADDLRELEGGDGTSGDDYGEDVDRLQSNTAEVLRTLSRVPRGSTNELLTGLQPIILFISYVLLALDTGLLPDVSPFGYTPLTVLISFAYTLALASYAVLTSYILRAATVTKLTPEEGPFVLDADRETADSGKRA